MNMLIMTIFNEKSQDTAASKKYHETGVEIIESSSSSQECGYDENQTKKLIRKIDWALLPFLALLYLLSFLDRTNIGNARLANLEKDLGMSGLEYNVRVSSRWRF